MYYVGIKKFNPDENIEIVKGSGSVKIENAISKAEELARGDNNIATTYLVVKILHEFKKESVIVDELNKNSIKFRSGVYVEKKEEITT